ncbi:phosphoglycerate dehydrogenase [Silvibacterium dinghuense]|uniref:D-3-phosphoglycerate dehydrogenase n=1 Tax=Silvibacterium dinghuense TaxID=1560006 RepID=A0A4Q1SK06_9BACT|nr:phosphoglycerate dehydrogenase [Silvibacterium dinghuense]RXS97620.1 phosphoglycerate dehydrogenase [Silvibacterium dinghuense]GGH00589.1 D-3-phosphoglycerate dehydrogenase [Silvibacterium dinghuense]
MKIVLAEKVSPATLAVFQSEPDWKIVTHDQIKDGLPAELADADGLVVRSAVQVDDALLASAPRLRVIGRAGVGVDNIDADAATRRGIVVMNTPGANAIAVAELTIGLMLALARQLPKANATMHAGKWEKKSLQGVELRNKKLGILGLGRIGLEVARRARSFGMEIIGHDPFVSAAVARENAIQLVSVEELFRDADYLSLHVGLTPQTSGIINAKTLATMKKGVRIVNCARGELIVEADLAEALKSGHVGGAALDVFHKEPLKDSPFFNLENVILTPHIAGSTNEAQEAVGVQIALQVREYLKLGVVQNAVNLPSLSHEEYVELAPYITLADRLGSFLSHFAEGNLESLRISYNGRISEGKTDLIRNSAIEGLLGHSEGVNRINATAVAEERGIRVSEEKKPTASGGAGNVLKLTAHTQSGEVFASGTVLHGTSARLLNLNGIDVEAPLEGNLLVLRNQDVPGVIGRIGTILGDFQTNIANFALGRAVRGSAVPEGTALAVIQVDGDLDETALRALRKVEAIAEVRVAALGEKPLLALAD